MTLMAPDRFNRWVLIESGGNFMFLNILSEVVEALETVTDCLDEAGDFLNLLA